MTNNGDNRKLQTKEQKKETQYYQTREHRYTGRQIKIKNSTHDNQESNQAQRQNKIRFPDQGAEERKSITQNTPKTPEGYPNLSLSQSCSANIYVNPQENSKNFLTYNSDRGQSKDSNYNKYSNKFDQKQNFH